ncbi:hypothetical protein GGI42DRAFT_324296, partial [Trichoderma sp. SZMC 28013]
MADGYGRSVLSLFTRLGQWMRSSLRGYEMRRTAARAGRWVRWRLSVYPSPIAKLIICKLAICGLFRIESWLCNFVVDALCDV